MNQMIVKTSELIYLNEVSKALKQKDFQIIGNSLIGIDNIQNCIYYVEMDTNSFSNIYLNKLIINTRELSAFIKTIMLESEFILEPAEYNSFKICTLNGIMYFRTRFNAIINPMLSDQRIYMAKYDINLRYQLSKEVQINDEINALFSLKKNDGCIYYNHQNKYFITLFSGLLPINKSDKVYLTIYPNTPETFIAKFRINKKKFNVYIYIAYLYI